MSNLQVINGTYCLFESEVHFFPDQISQLDSKVKLPVVRIESAVPLSVVDIKTIAERTVGVISCDQIMIKGMEDCHAILSLKEGQLFDFKSLYLNVPYFSIDDLQDLYAVAAHLKRIDSQRHFAFEGSILPMLDKIHLIRPRVKIEDLEALFRLAPLATDVHIENCESIPENDLFDLAGFSLPHLQKMTVTRLERMPLALRMSKETYDEREPEQTNSCFCLPVPLCFE